MDWSSVIVGAMALIGTLAGAYLSNRRSGALIAYRLEQLEAKVDRHNHFAQRMPLLEEKVQRLEALEERRER